MNIFLKIIAFTFLFPYLLISQIQWQQLNTGVISYLRDLSFISENIGWTVGHGGAILKTTNAGVTWIPQNSGTTLNLTNVCFLNENIGWAGGYNGIFLKTTNGGEDWQIISIGYSNQDIYGMLFIDENVGYAVVGELVPYYYGFIIKTTNGGANWQTKYSIYDDAYLEIAAIGSKAWAVGTGVAAYSNNSGSSWNFVFPNTEQWLYDVFFIDNLVGWAVGGGTDSEIILKTANGGISWQIQRENFQYQRLQGTWFTDLQQGWAVGENGVILRTTDGGTNWIQYDSPTTKYLREIEFPTPSVGYIVGENGIILKYTDNSNSIQVVDPNGGEILIGGATYSILWSSHNVIDVKLEYSVDNGINWITIINTTTSTGIYNWTVPYNLTSQGRIKISDVTNSNIFDVSDAPFMIQSSKSITVQKPNGGEIIEGGSNYEINWISTDVEDVMIEYSINNGASWSTITDSAQSTGIYLWDVPNILTVQGRVKISDLSTPSISDYSDNPFRIDYTSDIGNPESTNEFMLYQNYPNPFNPSTRIEFSVPQFCYVNLAVYDVLGNLVSTVVSEYKTAGSYQIEFNASNIPSGLYLYKFSTPDYFETKKMILLK